MSVVDGHCNYTELVAGREFICINKWHGDPVDKNGNDFPWRNSRGDPAMWRRHYMVRRYQTGNH